MTIAELRSQIRHHRESAATCRQMANSAAAVFRFGLCIQCHAEALVHDIEDRRLTAMWDRILERPV